MRLWLCLLLLAAGCLPDAEARPGAGHRNIRRTGNHASASGGSPDAGFQGTATYARTWDIAFDGRNCTAGAFNPWTDQTAIGMSLALDGTDTDYTCDYSTTGINEAGFGTALVDNGVRVAATTAGCWLDATPSSFPGIGDNSDWLIRIIFRANVAPGIATQFHEWNPGGSEAIEWNYAAADNMRLSVDEAAGTNYQSSLTAAVAAGAWHFATFFYEAVGVTNPVITVCLDGTCTVSTEHTGLHGPFAASGAFSIGGDNTCAANLPDTTILFFGYAIGANAAYWNSTVELTDCQSTGICP